MAFDPPHAPAEALGEALAKVPGPPTEGPCARPWEGPDPHPPFDLIKRHRMPVDVIETWAPLQSICGSARVCYATIDDDRVTCAACRALMKPRGERGSQRGG